MPFFCIVGSNRDVIDTTLGLYISSYLFQLEDSRCTSVYFILWYGRLSPKKTSLKWHMTCYCLIFLIYLYFLILMSELPSALSLTNRTNASLSCSWKGEKTTRKSRGTVHMSKDEGPTKAIKVYLTEKPIIFIHLWDLYICIFFGSRILRLPQKHLQPLVFFSCAFATSEE